MARQETITPETVDKKIFFICALLAFLLAGFSATVFSVALATSHHKQNVSVFKTQRSLFAAPNSQQIHNVFELAQNEVCMVEAVSLSSTNIGTGLILSQTGEVLTAASIINGASSIKVILASGNKSPYVATVISSDQIDGLALLRIQANLGPGNVAVFANSNVISVGEPIISVGYVDQIGQSPSVTSGIISAIGRNVFAQVLGSNQQTNVVNAIQTDAAISPGFEGGPLYDLNGHVVGLIVADAIPASSEPVAQNVGFAIPVSTINSVMPNLSNGISILAPEAYLGVSVTEYTTELSLEYGLPDVGITGLYVEAVAGNSPAYRAGLQLGDVIYEINGTKLRSTAELYQLLDGLHPNEVIELSYYDISTLYQTTKTVSVQLGKAPS